MTSAPSGSSPRRDVAPTSAPAGGDRVVVDVDLGVQLGAVRLHNPVLAASGCFSSGREMDRFYDVDRLGAVIVKSITLEPREGLPTPRMAETPAGMLNAIGLQNPGIERWLATDLPWLQHRGVAVIASIAGKTVDEFRQVARRLRGQPGVVGVEVNISCPNVEDRNIVFACRAEPSAAVIEAVRREVGVPVFAKLTSDVTDITEIARAVVAAGAHGLSLINTLLGMAIDVETRRPKLANTFGGLSGPAIRPIAVRNVWQVRHALPGVPIIGMGGVATAEDAVELMLAGADAVAVGTANFTDPFAAVEVVDGLARWCAAHGVEAVRHLSGAARA
ncbi:MAG TPA: dihydroorotate dehydrogenase [Nitriliruptorales bacterium]|nr:dihydroorotate dehydrogenase [Nitriliruptorales bacterium]